MSARRAEDELTMTVGVAFLLLVIFFTLGYLVYALLRPEKF